MASSPGGSECLHGLEVDVQLDFSCLLDRQVGGLFTLEDAAGIDAGLTKNVCNVSAVVAGGTITGGP